MKKLRLAPSKEGQRINGKGPALKAETITHDQAQALSNQGYAKWFVWCDAADHPCEAERPAQEAAPAPKAEPKAKAPAAEKLVPPKESSDQE